MPMCRILHKWSKWKQYAMDGEPVKSIGFVKNSEQVGGSIPLSQAHPGALRQRRICARCDEMQDKPVIDMRKG